MIKVKDGYAKLIGTTYVGSANRVLLSNGGDHVLGNASGNIPLSNGTVNTNLNADLWDGKHWNDLQIGGRNYYSYKNTSVAEYITKNSSINGYIISSNNTLNRIARLGFNGYVGNWTVSFEIKADSNCSVYVNLCDYEASTAFGENSNTAVTTSYVKHTYVFLNVGRYNTTAEYNGFLDIECASTTTIYIKDIKIEKGTKATDWSPAPEDLVDLHSEQTITGKKNFSASYKNALNIIRSDSTNGNSVINFSNASKTLGYIGISGSGSRFGEGHPIFDTGVDHFKIWYSENDGSGSGLDADLLDGQHGSYYATASSLADYYKVKGQMYLATDNWDWDNITSFGTYKIQSGKTISNHPLYNETDKEYQFGLAMVIRGLASDSENRTAQLYIPHYPQNNIPLYVRMRNNDAWNSWKAIPSTSYISAKLESYLPLTGGTLTGLLTLGSNSYTKTIKWANTDYSAATAIAFMGSNGDWVLRSTYSSDSTTADLRFNKSTLLINTNVALHSGNYTDYTVTKTGGGASGTWEINISGSSTIASRLGLNGIDTSTTYGTYAGIIQSPANGPEASSWHNSIKILHNNSDGYYTQLAHNFTGSHGLWHRSNRAGIISRWYRLIDDQGGTIVGTLTIKRNASVIRYINTDETVWGWLGFNAKDNPVVYMGDGTTCYNLIHSGNIGSQSVKYAASAGDANTLDGLDSINFFRLLGKNEDINTYADGSHKNGMLYINTTSPSGINAPFSYGSILSLNVSAASWMIACSSSGNLSFRNRWWSEDGNAWGDWKKFAFISDIPTKTSQLTNDSGFVTGGPYIPLSGTTGLSGSIVMQGSSNTTPFIRNFTLNGTSGWAREIMDIQVDGSSKFVIGAKGNYTKESSSNSIEYAYIGCNNFDGLNLKITAESLKWGDNTILHAGNYNSYAPTLTGGGASGTWGIDISGSSDKLDGYHESSFLRYRGELKSNVNFNDYYNGSYVNTTGNGSGNSNNPISYGYLLTFPGAGSSSYYAGWQFSAFTTTLQFRCHWDYAWGNWITVITDQNISLQSVSYATTAGTANSVDWANVTNKPDFSNYVTLDGTQTITGPKTFTNNIYINSSYSITDSSGNGILGVYPKTWTGIPSDGSAIGLGTISSPLYIRTSGNNLYHYRNNTSQSYTILDSGNYTDYINTTNFPGLNKTGTVTSVATGTGLTGGDITTSGTISINDTYQTYISNGDTAYGWGNHASAGYIKSRGYIGITPVQETSGNQALTGINNITTPQYGFTITTPVGNIQIGPQNNTGCHIYTNKDLFYFNKPIHYWDGSSAHVYINENTYTQYTPILNSSTTHATKSSVIYAPTTSGNGGDILISDGQGSAPVWTSPGNVTVGGAGKADKLTVARTIALSGAVTGSASFDGSANITIATSVNHTHSYLPLTGGTLTGSLTVGNKDANEMLSIAGNTSHLKMMTWTDATYIESGNADWNGNTPLHITGYGANQGSNLYLNFANIYCRSSGVSYVNLDSGNWSTYIDVSKYLPLTGGTLYNANNMNPLSINSDSGESGIKFQIAYANKGWFGYNASYGVGIYNYTRGKYLNYKDDGTLQFEGNEVLHSGNWSNYITLPTTPSGGYIGTTAVSSSQSAGQNITGIGDILPNATNSYDLGASDKYFYYVYANYVYGSYFKRLTDGDVYLAATNGRVDISCTHSSTYGRILLWNKGFTPTTNTNLGSSDYPWQYVYAKDYYVRGSAANTTAKLTSDATDNICLTVSGIPMLVCDSTMMAVRSSMSYGGRIHLGTSNYRWNYVYATHLNAEGGKFYTDANGAYWTSDIRLKTNIIKARNLNIADLLVEFDWKESNEHSWGYIAQELLEILPEAVSYNADTDRYAVNYNVAHSAAIASLTARIKELEEKLKKYGIQ